MLLDVVALVPPSSESLEDILFPQIEKNILEGLVSLFWSLQLLTDRHCRLADCKYFRIFLQLF